MQKGQFFSWIIKKKTKKYPAKNDFVQKYWAEDPASVDVNCFRFYFFSLQHKQTLAHKHTLCQQTHTQTYATHLFLALVTLWATTCQGGGGGGDSQTRWWPRLRNRNSINKYVPHSSINICGTKVCWYYLYRMTEFLNKHIEISIVNILSTFFYDQLLKVGINENKRLLSDVREYLLSCYI